MPPTRPAPVDPPSDGEDSAPEVLTLSSTKKSSKRRSEAVHAFELAQKSKRKRENRERDAALKEAKEVREEERRAVAVEGEEGGEEGEGRRKRRKKKKVISGSTAKGEKEISSKVPRTGEAEVTNAEERMERAMREAAEEEDSDVDSVISGVEDRSDEWHGFGGEIEEVGIGVSATIKHLPDHLFSAAAAAQVQPSSTSISGSTSALPKPKPHNKKPKKSKAKELLVGCVHFRLSLFSLLSLFSTADANSNYLYYPTTLVYIPPFYPQLSRYPYTPSCTPRLPHRITHTSSGPDQQVPKTDVTAQAQQQRSHNRTSEEDITWKVMGETSRYVPIGFL